MKNQEANLEILKWCKKNSFKLLGILFWTIFTFVLGMVFIYFPINPPSFFAGMLFVISFGLLYYLFIVFSICLVVGIFNNLKKYAKRYYLFMGLLGVGLLFIATYYYLDGMKGIVTLIGMLFTGFIINHWGKIWKWLKSFKANDKKQKINLSKGLFYIIAE